MDNLMEHLLCIIDPSDKGILTALFFTHSHQILQDPDSFLHCLQLGSSPRPIVLNCLQLLHDEWSQSVDIWCRQCTVKVLKH